MIDQATGSHSLEDRRPPCQERDSQSPVLDPPMSAAASTTLGVIQNARRDLDGVRFRLGDMVWAKVKSHPWWPGQIYDPALASSLARKSKRDAHLLVAFFGDSTFGWFPESELIPFEPNFEQKSKQTTASNFLEAVGDALDEIRGRVKLGLSCPCRISVETGKRRRKAAGLNLDRQVGEVKKAFEPSKMIAFIKDLACSPFASARHMLSTNVAEAQAHAFRVAAFSARNPQYEEYFRCVLQGRGATKTRKADMRSYVEMQDTDVQLFTEDNMESLKSKEPDGKTLLDTSLNLHRSPIKSSIPVEGKLGSENVPKEVFAYSKSHANERDRGSGKLPSKAKVRGTSKIKKRTLEEEAQGSPECIIAGIEGRVGTKGTGSDGKDAVPSGGRAETGTGTLRSKKVSMADAKEAFPDKDLDQTGNSESENALSRLEKSNDVVHGTDCPRLQVIDKKPKGLKRLVKKFKADVELMQSSTVEGSREIGVAAVSGSEAHQRQIKLNENKKERKSLTQSELTDESKRLNGKKRKSLPQSDSDRPSKRKFIPSDTQVSKPTTSLQQSAEEVRTDMSVIGGFRAQKVEQLVSLTRETACTADLSPRTQSQGGVLLEGMNEVEPLVSNGRHPELAKNLQTEGVVLEGSEEKELHSMEIEYFDRGEMKFEESNFPHTEDSERLQVALDGAGVQPIRIDNLEGLEDSSQTEKVLCSPSKVVLEEKESNGKMNEAGTIKSHLGKRSFAKVDATQKDSGLKKKRLKVVSSGEISKFLEHVNGSGTTCLHARPTSLKKKMGSRSVSFHKSDDKLDGEGYVKGSDEGVKVEELHKDLMSLAANPLDARKGELFCVVQKALTKFRKAVFQSDHGFFSPSEHARNSVSALPEIQEGRQPQGSEDCSLVTNRNKQAVSIAGTDVLSPEAEDFNLGDARPNIRGGQESQKRTMEERCDSPVQSAKKSSSSMFSKKVSMEESCDSPVQNVEKSASSMFSKKVSLSSVSLRPIVDAKLPMRSPRDVSNNFGPVNQRVRNSVSDMNNSKVNRSSQETGLLMKFPKGFALPSEAQLRATFIRFGQLRYSGTRIYRTSGSAQVVYQHACDAEAALKYVKENPIFGQAPVSFRLRQIHQTRDTDVAQNSCNLKQSKSIGNEERPPLSTVAQGDTNFASEEGTVMSRGNHVVSDNHLQIDSRNPLLLKSCLKKPDDPMFSTAKNGARVACQVNCSIENTQSTESNSITGNLLITDQLTATSSCEKRSGMLNDPCSYVDSTASPRFPLLDQRPFGFSVSTDIGDRMMSLLHQVSDLVGSSGIVI